MKTFSGKVVLVTGGSRGLGEAIARGFAEKGADVAFSYVSSEQKANQLVNELANHGIRAKTYRADQANSKQVEKLVDDVFRDFGSLDILVNNAALSIPGDITDSAIDYEKLDRQYSVNIAGVVTAIRTAVKYLPNGGRIITIGSGVAIRVGRPGAADYSATKGAVLAYSKGVARDLGSKNITVNVISAGIMDTDMAEPYKNSMPQIISNLAIQRFGKVEEVAAGVFFLAGSDASYITGTNLSIDGGYGA